MKRAKRWRYYCDYCKKSGGSGEHMKNHEKSCTMNPNRVCRVCAFIDEIQKPMDYLRAIIPAIAVEENNEGFEKWYSWKYDVDERAVINNLRDATNGCPACMLATIRQACPVSSLLPFDYKKEKDGFWSEINNNKAQESYESSHYQ